MEEETEFLAIPEFLRRDPRPVKSLAIRHRSTLAGLSDATRATIRRRAMKKVREILTTDHPSFISPEQDARIRAAFPDLPAGECVPPKEWMRQ